MLATLKASRTVSLRLDVPDFELGGVAVIAVHDASFSNEVGMKSQQGYILLVTQRPTFAGGGPVHLLDWSSTIKRAVRSTLAA